MKQSVVTTPALNLVGDLGVPAYNRRLSDKILGAFNHAYAVGDVETAERLRAILEDGEQARAARSDKRQSTGGANSVVRLADSWVAFVDARNVYQQLSERQGAAKNAVESALEAMKKAYLDWSAD